MAPIAGFGAAFDTSVAAGVPGRRAIAARVGVAIALGVAVTVRATSDGRTGLAVGKRALVRGGVVPEHPLTRMTRAIQPTTRAPTPAIVSLPFNGGSFSIKPHLTPREPPGRGYHESVQ